MNVFITGGSSGIGAALARRYTAQGAKVGLFARRQEALDAVVATLPPASSATYTGDVRDPPRLFEAAKSFMGRFGVPDVVIANAGVGRGALTEHAEDIATFREILEINVVGLVATFSPFIAAMEKARSGSLVGIASVAGFRGLPGGGAYSASKAAAITYLESLRLERRGSGVSVITICPGYIDTPMTSENPYPMPFLLRPERAAALMIRAIERRKSFYVLPWQMALVGRIMRALPRPLYDAAFAGAPRKPR